MAKETSTKYFSNKQEKLVADSLGWSVVSGSGARGLHPGDVQSEDWMGECKTHETPGHKIVFYSSVWKKIVDEASSHFKFPVLFVDDGSQKIENTWCMFSQKPAIRHLTTNYIYSLKTNVSFKSEELMHHRKEIGCVEPLLYTVRRLHSVQYISTFEDFITMFGSR